MLKGIGWWRSDQLKQRKIKIRSNAGLRNCGEQKKDTPQGKEFDLIVPLVESYERKHYPMVPPDPIDAIRFRREQMGMTSADMLKYSGSQDRGSEILNRKRILTLGTIKSLYKG